MVQSYRELRRRAAELGIPDHMIQTFLKLAEHDSNVWNPNSPTVIALKGGCDGLGVTTDAASLLQAK